MPLTLQIIIAFIVFVVSLLLWLINTVMYCVKNSLGQKETNIAQATSSDAEVVRTMIRHENDLVNHRLTWLLTLEGFLFAGSGLLWNTLLDNKPDIVFLFSITGMVAACSAAVVLDAACYTIMDLDHWWQNHKPNDFYGPDVIGFRGHRWLFALFAPWRLIPPTLVVVWLLLFLIKSGKL